MMPNGEMIYMKEDDTVQEIDENLAGLELDPNRSRQYIDPENVPSDIRRLYDESELSVVEQFIKTLDPTLAIPLKLTIYGGYTPEQIAEKMTLSVDEVAKRLKNARTKIAEKFPLLKQSYTSKPKRMSACVAETTFETQVLLYQNELYRYAFRLTHNKDAVQDLVQNTFEKAINAQEQYTEGNLKGWLKRIMYNHFVSMYRTKKRHEVGSLDAVAYGIANTTSSIDEQLHAILAVNQIKEFVGTLGESPATIWRLYYIEGRQYQEISDTLGMPLGTVKRRINTTKKKILQQFPELRVKKINSSSPCVLSKNT